MEAMSSGRRRIMHVIAMIEASMIDPDGWHLVIDGKNTATVAECAR
jgi:hypothetical protein